MLIEILTIEGCPNATSATEAVEQILREERLGADVRVVQVGDVKEARRRRFLGSPTIRVDGLDIEPGAEARTGYALSCRIYATASGFEGLPDPDWIRAAVRSPAAP